MRIHNCPSAASAALLGFASLASAQTIKSGDSTVVANNDTVAPAQQDVASDSNLGYESIQLTPEVLANLTSYNLTGIDAFMFAPEDVSNEKRSWGHHGHGHDHDHGHGGHDDNDDDCRVMPGDAQWPNVIDWFILDILTGGALIEGRPQAAACYKDWPEYDEEECQNITDSWSLPEFHCDAPTGIDFPLIEGVTCLPPSLGPPNATCSLGGLASYVVKVSNVAQVQLAINFARFHNLRLVVKNKGHDFNAKSTGAGALTIWTHWLKDIDYIPSYRTAESDGPALHLGAGVDVISLYEYADEHDLEAVGGIARTVGVSGGYSAGGGHSPLISQKGMAADQVLGLNVVLPDGRFVFADENHHTDLFWALRGGGGSTYGVVTSIIYRVYPKQPVATLTYSFGTSDTVDGDTFWAGVDAFWSTFPEMADAGHYRYFLIGCQGEDKCTLTMSVDWANGKTSDDLKEINAPFFQNLTDLGISVDNADYKDFSGIRDALEERFPASTEVMGTWTAQTGSRLWPRSNWEDPSKLSRQSQAIRKAVMKHGVIIAYNFKAAENVEVNQDNAVNPAWRNTLMHCMVPAFWTTDATPDVIADNIGKMTETIVDWQEASPGAGAYMSEANIIEPNLQQSFYGSNYDRLYELKQRYDPWGLFYAPTAVGSEDWYIEGQMANYPTQNGRLCRAK